MNKPNYTNPVCVATSLLKPVIHIFLVLWGSSSSKTLQIHIFLSLTLRRCPVKYTQFIKTEKWLFISVRIVLKKIKITIFLATTRRKEKPNYP